MILEEKGLIKAKIAIDQDLNNITVLRKMVLKSELDLSKIDIGGFFKKILKSVFDAVKKVILSNEEKLIALGEYLLEIHPILFKKGYFKFPRFINIGQWWAIVKATIIFINKLNFEKNEEDLDKIIDAI